jgi:sulfoxide reductase heme-binding subunit YedZ
MYQLQTFKTWKSNHPALWMATQIVVLGAVILASIIGLLIIWQISQLAPATAIATVFNRLFAWSSVQSMWYITRSAGLVAYLLLWLSTAWGLAVSSKIFDPLLHRAVTYDFHQFLSLLAIGFLFLHVLVLMVDRYMPYSLAQILFPFLSPYRPFWVGIGVIGFYLTLLVTVTFYLRKHIGVKAFQSIHVLSLVAFFGAALHGIFAGTDSALLVTRWMYAGTLLVVVFLLSHWMIMRKSVR